MSCAEYSQNSADFLTSLIMISRSLKKRESEKIRLSSSYNFDKKKWRLGKERTVLLHYEQESSYDLGGRSYKHLPLATFFCINDIFEAIVLFDDIELVLILWKPMDQVAT